MPDFFGGDVWVTLKEMVTGAISIFRIRDAFDIAIVAFLIYHLILLVKETRAGQLIKGVFSIYGELIFNMLVLVRNCKNIR